ncbi:MAG: DNA recombination protein RmuC [Calditrichaeota bacterium]|nr:MAG: DNA recombination protein RmuC [Calditrichota bacterium]MBL1205153.1 DNA recombination protein RmuC [Calditrichota bacterium]NOG44983.1 DNA recombination protein RmuC [Calditrichota bacterium]
MPLLEIGLFIFGLIIGVITTALIYSRQQKSVKEFAGELARQSQLEKIQELEKIISQLRESFSALSMDVLSKSTNEFLKLANQKFQDQSRRSEENLQGKKALIDQTLTGMKSELNKVQELVGKIENERKESYGQLSEQLKNSVEQTRHLQDTTNKLNNALSDSQRRGQWGERMAEDVLRMAGLIEGINYRKQKSLENSSSRPDFTFLLPHDLIVNMDVKFPLSNYLSYLETNNDLERNQFKNQFLKDVRQRIKDVVTRDYINPANNTVDYMIVFIPNEQVYAFINEHDQGLLDDALKNKVILSSPVTLYAILAVIRQAVENFNLEQTAAQILDLLSDFNKQWDKFKEKMDSMGRKIEMAQKEFFELNTVRSNQLEKPLQKIDSIRTETNSFLPDTTFE